MELYTKLNHIILMLLMTPCAAQLNIEQNWYQKVDPGHDTIGTVGTKLTALTIKHCSIICLLDGECTAYQYNGTGPGNCILIKRNCTVTEGQIFESDNKTVAYEEVPTRQADGLWAPPVCWTGPEAAALYWSFDTADGLAFMEGTTRMNFAPLLPGKVNNALPFDRTKHQWVDLGIQTEACMTRPETCGAAGGSVAFWLKVIDCPDNGGILSTHSYGKTSCLIHCSSTDIVFYVNVAVGQFQIDSQKPSGWTHVVLNYIATNDGRVFRLCNLKYR